MAALRCAAAADISGALAATAAAEGTGAVAAAVGGTAGGAFGLLTALATSALVIAP